ncbi:carboxypeptidase B-like [Argopecten irradians]|uniref:carboxypeptidase B-like n=1 Tax=Argopecten irradians TaxID=31199 RepID=UPI00371BDB2E
MMRVHSLVLSFLAVLALVHSSQVRYDGYKVVRVVPQKAEHVVALKSLQGQTGHDKVDFWIPPRQVGVPVDISIAPALFQHLYASFTLWGIHPVILTHDVQEKIDAQTQPRLNVGVDVDFDYGKYHSLSEIESWMKSITEQYSDKASLFEITKSYEGRTINGIKIKTTTESKPAFWMEGGIHSREWISPATVIYMTAQMLETYDSNKDMKDFVDSFEWYILPVFNVDGYEYTWTTDRMWRKTRSKQGECVGVDPNRNWDMEWCKEGASKNPCTDTYCGPSAFSEVEVKGVADYIKGIPNVRGFIDFHSYSELWMSPWGYTKELPKDYSNMDAAGKAACDALKAVHGTKYDHGSIANIIYVASGSSADWTYGKLDIVYSYGVELRDKGLHGFLLPADQIIPSGEETMQAVIALAKYITEH